MRRIEAGVLDVAYDEYGDAAGWPAPDAFARTVLDLHARPQAGR